MQQFDLGMILILYVQGWQYRGQVSEIEVKKTERQMGQCVISAAGFL